MALVVRDAMSRIPPARRMSVMSPWRIALDAFVLSAFLGAVTVLPLWRHAWGTLDTPRAVLSFLSMLGGAVVAGWLISGAATIVTFMGSWAGALGVLRFVHRWAYDE